MEKQVQFKAINEQGQLVVQPLFVGSGLEKTAEALEMRSRLHPRVQDFVRAVRPTSSGIYVLVNALGAGEYWGSNVNGDLFPEKGLIHSPSNWENLLVSPDQAREVGVAWPYGYPTFMGAYPYKHHVNKDPSRAFGRVELSTWNPAMHRVELVVYLDRALCMQFDALDIIERIEHGEFPDVSMGCKVPYDVCTICENPSKTRNDYCQHALTMMNKILPDGRKVAVRNDYPKFFDISFVFIGADKTAKVMAKLAQKGNRICMGDFCTAPHLSAEVGEMFKTADPVDENPNNFGVSKEKAIADRDMEQRTSLRKVTPPAMQPAWDKYAGLPIPKAVVTHGADKARKAVKGALIGGGIGATASYAANSAVGESHQVRRRSAVKDGVAGGVIGALTKLAEELEIDGPRVSQDELIRQGVASVPGTSRYVSEEELRNRAGRHRFNTLGDYLKEKNASRDIGRERAMSQYRRQKLGEMYGVDLMNKEANDPIKKKIKVQGVPICLEWLKGETREYKKGGVVKYKRLMEADYGYIPGTVDSDGEELDVYVGPDREARNAYVIRQMKRTGGFDEHKVMVGYSSKSSAKASYVHHMGGTPERFGGMQAIPITSLVALFGDNKAHKEKAACDCHGVGDDCGGSIEKLASLLFPISKSASHAKLSEIIKSLPAGPFTKETLPKLESAEKDIPNDVLDNMSSLPLGSALSTPTMAGMVLKPREFQRMVLMSIGERPLADDLDNKGMTFGQTNDVDDSIPLNESSVDDGLMNLLCRLGLVRDRSAAGPALGARSATSASADKPFRPMGPEKTASGPLMSKLSAAYNGYRRNVLRKAASISNFMTTDPQLRSELFGSSMVQAFAGGVDKVATASVFSPDSLAYLVGAYTDRDLHMTNEVVASLAQTGAVAEAA